MTTSEKPTTQKINKVEKFNWRLSEPLKTRLTRNGPNPTLMDKMLTQTIERGFLPRYQERHKPFLLILVGYSLLCW